MSNLKRSIVESIQEEIEELEGTLEELRADEFSLDIEGIRSIERRLTILYQKIGQDG